MSDMTLGQKVREVRLNMKMTQKELAGDFITRNMLSQIENEQATPSMKTMEHIAKQLGKPIGYFLDENHEDSSLSTIITNLMVLNEKKDYEASVALIEEQITKNPLYMKKGLMINIYMNSYMRLGKKYMDAGQYIEAKTCFEKLLRFESDLLLEDDIYLYKVYEQLAEVNAYIPNIETAKLYYQKGKKLMYKLLASREVQSLYIHLIEGDYKELMDKVGKINIENYDEYSLARYNMIVGSAYYNEDRAKEAIDYFNKSIGYYEREGFRSITAMIYEKLSRCYSKIDDYKSAYDCLQKAQSKKLTGS